MRQSRLPFGTRIETMEGSRLTDAGVWTLTTTSAGSITKLGDITEIFPERRFLAEPSKERPFRGGLVCGARLGRTDWDISTGGHRRSTAPRPTTSSSTVTPPCRGR